MAVIPVKGGHEASWLLRFMDFWRILFEIKYMAGKPKNKLWKYSIADLPMK